MSGSTLTVSGAVTLPENTAAERQRARVLVALSTGVGSIEQHTAKLNAQLSFKATWKTRLAGPLTLTARVRIGGKNAGKVLTRTITVGNRNAPQQLIGKLKLVAGAAPANQPPTGTYFEMLQPTGSPLANLNSSGANKNYTPLFPGTDGGLLTGAYQPAPNPPFSGGTSGGALAASIIRPAQFFGVNVSAETASVDAQLGAHDPLPAITVQRGVLTGQLAAWVAQWNGQSFDQGTPKPNGTLPPPTTKLLGTYDRTTRRFTLVWKSLIVGGPFNGFTGSWHLQGTFVPAAS